MKDRSSGLSNYIRHFKRWLEQNADRFNHKPRPVRSKAGRIHEFTFYGVDSGIRGYFGKNGNIGVSVASSGQCWDLLVTFDVRPRRSKEKGYYCVDCEEGNAPGIYFKTLDKLLSSHSFEPLLKWANKNLTKEKRLRLLTNTLPGASKRTVLGWTAAEIIGPAKGRNVKSSGKRGQGLWKGFTMRKEGTYELVIPVLSPEKQK